VGRHLAFMAVIAVTTAGVMIPAAAAEVDYPDAFEVCTSCHVYHANEPPQEGPPLWGVFGRKVASVEGFTYSTALQEFGAKADRWDAATLDKFLTNPRVLVPGTRMSLGGVRNPPDRAEVINFLQTLTDVKPVGGGGN